MPVVSDIVCMFASYPAPPIWCFPDFEQCVSFTGASGTDMQAARTQPPPLRVRNSGRRSSTPTWSATDVTDSHCSRQAGGSRSYGNAHCASMECSKLRRCWTSGCVGTIWSSRRMFQFGRHRPEPVRPAVRYAQPRLGYAAIRRFQSLFADRSRTRLTARASRPRSDPPPRRCAATPPRHVRGGSPEHRPQGEARCGRQAECG